MRSSILALVLSVFSACVTTAAPSDGGDNSAACALDTSATYTVTVVPNGRPQVGTLSGLLGPCDKDLDPNERWVPTCTGDVLTYDCGGTRFTYTVRDATADGYSATIANTLGSLDLHIVEGGAE